MILDTVCPADLIEAAQGSGRSPARCKDGHLRDGRLQGIEAIIEGQQRGPAKGERIASSSSIDDPVDPRFFGPVGRSASEPRFFPLTTVFRLIPLGERSQNPLDYVYCSTDCLRGGGALPCRT